MKNATALIRALFFAGCAAVALLTGCSVSAPRTHFYTLGAEPAAIVQSSPIDARAVTVSVWQVTIPEIADRAQMVVRTGPNKVDVADFHRWAEPLRRGVPRTLAESLAQRLGEGYVVVAGQPAGMTPELRVAVDLQKFEATLGDAVTIEALWNVRRDKGVTLAGRSVIAEAAQAGDHTAIAAAYSRALARVADDISKAITGR